MDSFLDGLCFDGDGGGMDSGVCAGIEDASVFFCDGGGDLFGSDLCWSLFYRRQLRTRSQRSTAELVALLCVSAFLPILINDPRFVRANWQWYADPLSVVIILISICPFCGILGYLTPSLVDDYASGSPERAGKAYALNVFGCILGPLFASYILLPNVSNRYGLILLSLPLLLIFIRFWKSLPKKPRLGFGSFVSASVAIALFFSGDYEDKGM